MDRDDAGEEARIMHAYELRNRIAAFAIKNDHR